MRAGLLAVLILVAGAATRAHGALQVQPVGPVLTPQQLVDSLLGGGVSASNVHFSGASSAAGAFVGGTGIIGFDTGVLLSSGRAQNAIGPNDDSGASAENGLPGDADLDALLPAGAGGTFDATVLEFDFVPTSDQLSFQYVFASEEYNEFVGEFNDVFAFFVNGVNAALLPDSTTVVSINTVNGGINLDPATAVNPQFYRNNDCFAGPCVDVDTQADGLTVVLQLTATVTPNQTNHIKLAIADAGDESLDSWVFIREGSIRTEICTNGVDDDRDDLTDCQDPDCAFDPACATTTTSTSTSSSTSSTSSSTSTSSTTATTSSSSTSSTSAPPTTTTSTTTSTSTTTTSTSSSTTTSTSTTSTTTTSTSSSTTTSTSTTSTTSTTTSSTTTTSTSTTTTTTVPGCADGTREGLGDVQAFPDVAACAGAWQGHVSNGGALCASGWAVCSSADGAILGTVSFDSATSFPGCFAYDASQDGDACGPCTGTPDHDAMAGMGAGCDVQSSEGAGCTGSGRVDVNCCDGEEPSNACDYDPDQVTGVVCCRIPTTTTTTSTSTTTSTTLPACGTAADCDDGDPCNGTEACADGRCTVARGAAAACEGAAPLAVVTNFDTDEVTFVDTRLQAVEGTVAVGDEPWGVAWTPDGARVFITNRNADTVSVIDTLTRTVIATVPVGPEPLGVAVHPFKARAYVTSYDADRIDVIDTGTLGVVNQIGVGNGPAGVAVHPAGGQLYVANYLAGTVSVIDAVTENVVATTPTPPLPVGVAVHPSGAKVYVPCLKGREVAVLGTVSNTLLTIIRSGRRPVGVAFNDSGTLAYVTNNGDDTLTVIDPAQDRVIDRINVGDSPLGVSVAGDESVFVADSDSSQLTVLGGTPTTVPVAATPVAIGDFIGTPPDACPDPAPQCDDANPYTGNDQCVPRVGCQQDPLTGVVGIRAGVDAMRTIVAEAAPTDPIVQDVGPDLSPLLAAIETVQTGGDRAALRQVAKGLKPILRSLQRARRRKQLGAVGAQLLDIARRTKQEIRQLVRGKRRG